MRDYYSANPYLSKMGGFACQWLGNVDMHMYAKCVKNIPCGSRKFSLTSNKRSVGQTDGLTL